MASDAASIANISALSSVSIGQGLFQFDVTTWIIVWVGYRNKRRGLVQVLIDAGVEFGDYVRVLRCHIICFSDIFLEIVEFQSILLIIRICVETDQLPSTSTHCGGWWTEVYGHIVWKMNEDCLPRKW